MSLKQTIYEYLRGKYPEVIHKGEIGKKAVNDWSYENENAGRRCRELVKEGKIEVIYKDNQATYRWLPPKDFIPSRLPQIARLL